MVPRFFSDLGIRQIIAPTAALDHRLWTQIEGFHAILYPFGEGHNAFEAALTELQWVDFGAALRKIHAAEVPPKLFRRVHQEAHSPQWRERVRMLLERALNNPFDEPVATQYAGFLTVKADEMRRGYSMQDMVGRRSILSHWHTIALSAS